MKLEILEELSGSNDQMFVKRKRTRRPRPASSTSSNGGAGEFYNSLVSSPTTSSGISTTTEEDEDMANCLILLARGNSPPQPEEIQTAAVPPMESKFSSRKFEEMVTTTTGKVGIFVYECKTCNRTFPSFQALGGHRASHKKPKTAAEAAAAAAPRHDPEEREEEGQLRKLSNIISQSPSTQFPSKASLQSDLNKPKMHECSICGSEFGSGQALGGHMRRHRPAPAPNTSAKILPTSVDSNTTSSSHDKARNMLALDLNLPAPAEEAEQQPRVVLALVDCHF